MALISHGIDVIGPDTSLYIAEPGSLGMLLSEKIRHEGLHSRNIEHNSGGTVGNERNGSDINMASFLIEVKPCIS
jgi:hypothetical protein